MTIAQIAADTISAAFATFGEAVIRDPDGVADTITVIRTSPDEEFTIAGRPLQTDTVVFEVRAADAAGLAADTVVEVAVNTDASGIGVAGTGERRITQGVPVANDRLRGTFLIDTRPA